MAPRLAPTLLKLDFDSARLPAVEKKLYLLYSVIGVRIVGLCFMRTRRGWHVVVALAKRLPAAQVVAVQAILGSDPFREMFNLHRIRAMRRIPSYWKDESKWNVLYESHDRRVTI